MAETMTTETEFERVLRTTKPYEIRGTIGNVTYIIDPSKWSEKDETKYLRRKAIYDRKVHKSRPRKSIIKYLHDMVFK